MIDSTLTELNTHQDELRTIARRHPWRWVSALLALAAGTAIVWAFASSPNLQWNEVGSYLTARSVIDGIGLTILLTLVAQGMGTVGGIILAVMRRSSNPVLKMISGLYLWIFRGTPVLIQIIFWYNLALIFPAVALHIPFTSIGFSVATNSLITPVAAAIIALGLNEAAYMAEIVRGGLISVEQGQSEAAATIGMTGGQAMRYVILPQALRTIVPPTGNELINMLKNTSLVSVIAARELLTASQQIYGVNYLVIELLIVASIWYLALSTVASLAQTYLERRLQVVLRVRPQPWTTRAANHLTSLRSAANLTSDGKS
ncbi:amino acid ABC transporter permease [Streptomyces sp. NBC_00984]|uniref:amino acid ABC transporter permease n=1 Tax=Streptomyces sp. NBC_00984 TaxID=2903700 RepID=UPI003868EBFA|nr:amino acid ABC transporter permease [Streptomyces sp. NBC_00984]